MDHTPEAWGRPRNDIYGSYDGSYLHTGAPTQHTQQPQVTGTTVVAVKYKDGIVIAADTLASYGSLARYTNIHRLIPYSDTTMLGFGGDVSDMQYLHRMLTALATDEAYIGDAHALCARNLHKYLAKVFYGRRTKMNPLWNAVLVAGFDDQAAIDPTKPAVTSTIETVDATKKAGEETTTTTETTLSHPATTPAPATSTPFLASVDLLGTTFTAPSIATGFGAYLAQPLLRKLVPDEAATTSLTREDAEKAIRECMKVLFYRDARSLSEYDLAVVTREGTHLLMDQKVEGQSWEFAEDVKGYGAQTV